MESLGGHDEEVVENCFAGCSGLAAVQNFEEGYPRLPEVVCGCSAGVHFVEEHSVLVLSCSLTFAEWNSEMLQHAVVVRPGEEVQGSELFAVDCFVLAEGQRVGWNHYGHWVQFTPLLSEETTPGRQRGSKSLYIKYLLHQVCLKNIGSHTALIWV